MSDNKEITLADIHKELVAIRRINANTYFAMASILAHILPRNEIDKKVDMTIKGDVNKIFDKIEEMRNSFLGEGFS